MSKVCDEHLKIRVYITLLVLTNLRTYRLESLSVHNIGMSALLKYCYTQAQQGGNRLHQCTNADIIH